MGIPLDQWGSRAAAWRQSTADSTTLESRCTWLTSMEAPLARSCIRRASIRSQALQSSWRAVARSWLFFYLSGLRAQACWGKIGREGACQTKAWIFLNHAPSTPNGQLGGIG